MVSPRVFAQPSVLVAPAPPKYFPLLPHLKYLSVCICEHGGADSFAHLFRKVDVPSCNSLIRISRGRGHAHFPLRLRLGTSPAWV